MSDYATMEAGREMDAACAVKVMGCVPREVRVCASAETVLVFTDAALSDGAWHARELEKYGSPRPYSTDPAADYTVLERVRGTWDIAAKQTFGRTLFGMWSDRLPLEETGLMRHAQYLPGDYTRAALLALEAAK